MYFLIHKWQIFQIGVSIIIHYQWYTCYVYFTSSSSIYVLLHLLIYFGQIFRQPHFLTWRVVKKRKQSWQRRLARVGLLARGNRFRIVQGVPEGSPVILQKVYSSIRVIMFHECRTESINAKRFPMHQFGFKNKVLQRSCLKSKFHTNTFFWCF